MSSDNDKRSPVLTARKFNSLILTDYSNIHKITRSEVESCEVENERIYQESNEKIRDSTYETPKLSPRRLPRKSIHKYMQGSKYSPRHSTISESSFLSESISDICRIYQSQSPRCNKLDSDSGILINSDVSSILGSDDFVTNNSLQNGIKAIDKYENNSKWEDFNLECIKSMSFNDISDVYLVFFRESINVENIKTQPFPLKQCYNSISHYSEAYGNNHYIKKIVTNKGKRENKTLAFTYVTAKNGSEYKIENLELANSFLEENMGTDLKNILIRLYDYIGKDTKFYRKTKNE